MSDHKVICVTTGKIKHRRHSGAHRQAKELDRKGREAKRMGEHKGNESYVYACEHCGGFHVSSGRKPREMRGVPKRAT